MELKDLAEHSTSINVLIERLKENRDAHIKFMRSFVNALNNRALYLARIVLSEERALERKGEDVNSLDENSKSLNQAAEKQGAKDVRDTQGHDTMPDPAYVLGMILSARNAAYEQLETAASDVWDHGQKLEDTYDYLTNNSGGANLSDTGWKLLAEGLECSVEETKKLRREAIAKQKEQMRQDRGQIFSIISSNSPTRPALEDFDELDPVTRLQILGRAYAAYQRSINSLRQSILIGRARKPEELIGVITTLEAGKPMLIEFTDKFEKQYSKTVAEAAEGTPPREVPDFALLLNLTAEGRKVKAA